MTINIENKCDRTCYFSQNQNKLNTIIFGWAERIRKYVTMILDESVTLCQDNNKPK